MIATIIRRTKAIQWSQAFASRETAAVAITNDDASAFTTGKTYVLAITDAGTTLATTEHANSTALTASADGKTLTGALYLGETAMQTRMAALTADSAEYRAHLVTKDNAETRATDDVTIEKTDYAFTTTTTTTTTT